MKRRQGQKTYEKAQKHNRKRNVFCPVCLLFVYFFVSCCFFFCPAIVQKTSSQRFGRGKDGHTAWELAGGGCFRSEAEWTVVRGTVKNNGLDSFLMFGVVYSRNTNCLVRKVCLASSSRVQTSQVVHTAMTTPVTASHDRARL